MKKRVIAAILGVMLSLSMGLEAGAAALDSGFESGFTAEQTAEEQLPESEGSEEVQQPSEEQDTSEGTETDNTSDGDGFADGFISGEVAEEEGSGETEPVQNFDEAGQNVTQENQTENVQAAVSGTVFERSDWEEPESGRFRLHKKTVKPQAATEAEVSVQSSDLQEAEDAQISTLPEDAAQTTEVGQSSFQDQYYTAADGIVELTIKSEKGALHKGYYLFDTNGYLVTGEISLNGTESQAGTIGNFYFTTVETAESYKEYASEGVGLKPWTTNIGQQKRDYWLWESKAGNFRYYGTDGKNITISRLEETAKAQNTYTGYFKINNEYYCLDSNGTPKTGEVQLNVNGTAFQYYFQPAADASEIPGKMLKNGWAKFDTAKGEQWRYYDSGNKDSSKMGQLLMHGTMVTNLDSKKDTTGNSTYLIDKNGYLLKSTMKKASDGKYYFTDKNGKIYTNRIVTYKNKTYYVTSTGAKATWKNGWHRCPGAGNRMYYFGSSAGRIIKKTGWQKVTKSNGKFYGWFLFNSKGKHYADKLLKKKGYYFKTNGKLASGLTEINGNTYFFRPSTSSNRDGRMVKNQMFVYKKKTYYAGSDGVLRKDGWQYVNGEWYYFKNMTLVTNSFVQRNGKYGYVDSTGRFSTGWVIVDDAKNLVRYINPDKKGYVTNTSKWIDGKLYYFDKNGYRINDLTSIYKSNYSVEVDRVNGVMTIYADSARTIPVKSIRVSVGNPGTDTPTGTYRLTSYSRWQPLMGPSWGQYGTHVDGAGQGGIFVHSIACGAANSYNLPVSAYYRLGSPASHGCIRTCVADAKWVYEHCNGSSIRIFDGTYKSNEVFKGPLGRRALVPLKGMKNGGYYDPTDPNA